MCSISTTSFLTGQTSNSSCGGPWVKSGELEFIWSFYNCIYSAVRVMILEVHVHRHHSISDAEFKSELELFTNHVCYLFKSINT